MIAFFPDFRIHSEAYEPGKYLDFKLNNNYYQLLGGMFLLSALALLALYLAVFRLALFDQPGLLSVILTIVGVLLLLFVFGSLGDAKGPFYGKEKISFRPEGIYHNYGSDPKDEQFIPLASITSLAFEQHRNTMKVYLNSAKDPLFEFDLGKTMFAALPSTLITFVQLIFDLPTLEEMRLGDRNQYRLEFPTPVATAPTAQQENTEAQVAVPSPAPTATTLLLDRLNALHYVSARLMGNGWLNISTNKHTFNTSEFLLHPETGEISIPKIILKDAHYTKDAIRRVFSTQKKKWVKYQGDIAIGRLKLQTSTGDPTLLQLSVNLKGDGSHQQFELQRDLRKLEEIIGVFLT